MDKTAIKNFSIWARNKLIADITYKAGLLGVAEEGIKDALPQSTQDAEFYDIGTKEPYVIHGEEIKQRKELVAAIKRKASQIDYKDAYRNVVEEVAYTWFNRLIAIRFMEVNDYMPAHIRVLSSDSKNKLEPDLVTTPFDAELEFTQAETDKIMQMKTDNQVDALFRFLFIKQCNALNAYLPKLFEKTSDYTELLLNVSVTDQDGIVYHLTHDIREIDFKIRTETDEELLESGEITLEELPEGQVEIIGWLYQYYNIEPKAKVDKAVKSGNKVRKDEIPAKTQLFTPDWIVKYMVENSVGRLWINHLEVDASNNMEADNSSAELKKKWRYYVGGANHKEDVQNDLYKVMESYKSISPEQIKVIDPCMGSGHILVYAFDVLLNIYESYGYSRRDAAKSIIENNIYGLDIDDRAFQLAYFAIMMKARQYNRRILNAGIEPNLCSIRESNGMVFNKELAEQLVSNTGCKVLEYLLTKFRDAKEYGSTLLVEKMDYDSFISEWIQAEEKIYSNVVLIGWYKEIENEVLSLAKQASILASEYEVVVTNPPYMGSSMMNTNLNEYLKKNYPLSKGDLFAVFIEVANRLVKRNYLSSLITMQSWMFLSSYEKLREELVGTDLVTMLHLGARAFEEISGDVVQTAAFVLRKSHVNGNVSICDRLIDIDNASEKEKVFLTGEKRCFSLKENFERIPAKPYAYWISEDVLKSFKGRNLGELAEIVSGMTTGNNDLYLREWNEVDINSIAFGYSNVDDIDLSLTKWIPYHKGGEQRKWYGNNEYVVNWSQSGNFNRAKTTMTYLYLKPCVTWSDISGNTFAGRFCNGGFMFDVKGSCGFGNEDDLKYLMAIFNSKIMPTYIEALNPTTTTQVGDLKRIPLKPIDATIKEMLFPLVEDNIRISKEEWDNYEQSWDFMTHPLIKYKKSSGLIIEAMNELKNSISLLMQTMRDNEEKINSIIIAEYGLQNEISPDVSIENVSLRQIDERKEICSLLSYAVGCMFGRYSVDKQGIAYAGGEWKTDNYSNFIPDEDNVVLITDEEYFADDIVGKFCSWLEVVFGKEALEANIQYIAETLENKAETSRAVIRNFFINEFEEFHIKGYEKRPIYWLFDSGKQNGFKALVYMHRYNADTIGNLRVDYLHRMERIYESEINRMQDTIDNSSNAREVTAATKRKEKLQKQLKECQEYDEKIGHLALSRIDIDLDDGVKVNYEKVQTANDGKKYQVLAKI